MDLAYTIFLNIGYSFGGPEQFRISELQCISLLRHGYCCCETQLVTVLQRVFLLVPILRIIFLWLLQITDQGCSTWMHSGFIKAVFCFREQYGGALIQIESQHFWGKLFQGALDRSFSWYIDIYRRKQYSNATIYACVPPGNQLYTLTSLTGKC